MKISVNIITYNRRKKLIDCLESILLQTFKKYEIVIVDNASKDDTEKAVKEFIKDNPETKIVYEKQEKNLGVAGGRNRTFELSSGEFIYTFDDDAIIEDKELFAKAIKRLDSDKEIIIAATQIYEPANDYFFYSIDKYSNNETVFTFKGGSNFIRREFFLDKLLYPSNLLFGAEENYASLQVWGAEKKVVLFSDIQIIHIPDNVNRFKDRERILNGIINDYIIKKLLFPCILIPVINFSFFLRLLKHRFISVKYIKKIFKLHEERYNKLERNRMTFRVWIIIKKKFGFKNVI